MKIRTRVSCHWRESWEETVWIVRPRWIKAKISFLSMIIPFRRPTARKQQRQSRKTTTWPSTAGKAWNSLVWWRAWIHLRIARPLWSGVTGRPWNQLRWRNSSCKSVTFPATCESAPTKTTRITSTKTSEKPSKSGTSTKRNICINWRTICIIRNRVNFEPNGRPKSKGRSMSKSRRGGTTSVKGKPRSLTST